MNTVGISADEQNEIFRLVAGIASLGNVSFTETAKEEAVIDNKQGPI